MEPLHERSRRTVERADREGGAGREHGRFVAFVVDGNGHPASEAMVVGCGQQFTMLVSDPRRPGQRARSRSVPTARA